MLGWRKNADLHDSGGVGGGLGEELDGCGGVRQGPAGIAESAGVRSSQSAVPAGWPAHRSTDGDVYLHVFKHRCLKKKNVRKKKLGSPELRASGRDVEPNGRQWL